MAEKSGLQMIEETLGGMAVLDRRLQVVEHLLKELLAKTNATTPKTITPPQPVKAPPTIEAQGTCELPATRASAAPLVKTSPNTRVTGKVKDKEGRPLSDMSVSVYDAANKLVKQTKTNRAGDWIAMLPPGKYGAEFAGRMNGSMTFTVQYGATTQRVAQPELQ